MLILLVLGTLIPFDTDTIHGFTPVWLALHKELLGTRAPVGSFGDGFKPPEVEISLKRFIGGRFEECRHNLACKFRLIMDLEGLAPWQPGDYATFIAVFFSSFQ